MKKLILLALFALAGWTVASAAPPHIGVSFGVFYNSLDPYGEWIHIQGGMYGWRPAGVAVGWRPYYYGRWVWTDDGWYWDSDEPWAWAAYHYGRWYHDDYYGWIWIPGEEWAPAWVEWRYGGGCIGWAPLSPYAVFSVSWGIHYTTRWVTPIHYWTFVDCHYMSYPDYHRYAYRSEDNTRWFGRTRGAGSVGYDRGRVVTRGPERTYVERTGNIRISRADLVEVGDRPSQRVVRGRDGRDQVEVYRPRVDAGTPGRGEPSRPGRIRESERPVNIDVAHSDAGRREGRNLDRADEYRARRSGMDRRTDDGQRGSGNRSDVNGAPDRREPRPREIDRPPADGNDRQSSGRQTDVGRVPDRRSQPVDRPPRYDGSRERRQEPPERIMRRSPEQRPDMGRGGYDTPRSGGGSSRGSGEAPRGGDGGGRRGGARR